MGADLGGCKSQPGGGGARLSGDFFQARGGLEEGDAEASVGVPEVAAAVAAFALGMEIFDEALARGPACGAESMQDEVALGIDIRCDVVGDLACRVAEADAFVERGGAEPDFFPLAEAVPFPEAHMVAVAGAVADRQLEGEVFFAAEQKQIAHRRLVVGAMEEGVNDDADAGIESDGVGGKPSSGRHCSNEALPGAVERDVDWIAGMADGGFCETVTRRVAVRFAGEEAPGHWSQQISGCGPDHHSQKYFAP